MEGKTRFKQDLRSVFGGILIFIVFFSFTACPEPPNDSTESNPFEQKHIEWPSLADSYTPKNGYDAQNTGRINVEINSFIDTAFSIILDGVSSNSSISSIAADIKKNLYFCSSYEKNNGIQHWKLYSITENGELNWTWGDIDNYSLINCGPLITNEGLIIIGGSNSDLTGFVYAFNDDGTMAWEVQLSDNIVTSGLAITDDDDIIALTKDGNLYAINNGSVLWTFNNSVDFQPSGYNSVAISPSDNTIYITGKESSALLYAVNNEGILEWSYADTSLADIYIYHPPVIDNEGNIYVGITENNQNGFVLSISPEGSLNWKYDCDFGVICEMTITVDGYLCFSDINQVIAVDLDGNQIFSYPSTSVGPLISDKNGNIIILGGSLLIIDNSGNFIDEFIFNRVLWNYPAVTENLIIIGSVNPGKIAYGVRYE